jgi:hypothetical protein
MQYLCETCNLNKLAKNWEEFVEGYAGEMGIDMAVNDKPWRKWVAMRQRNGLL